MADPRASTCRRRVRCDHGVGAEVHVVRLVPVGRPDVPVGEILFGSQVGLGQWGAAKRDPRFPADEHDWPGEPSSRKVAAAVPRPCHLRRSPSALNRVPQTCGLIPSAFVARPHFAHEVARGQPARRAWPGPRMAHVVVGHVVMGTGEKSWSRSRLPVPSTFPLLPSLP